MKFLILLLLILSYSVNFAQVKKPKLKALVNTKQFYDPTIGNYVEVQMQFISYTLNYLKTTEGQQAEIEISLIFEKEGKVVKFDKYSMKSPVMTNDFVEDFYDIQRFDLIPGDYTLSIEMLDKNDSTKSEALTGNIALTVKSKSVGANLSEVKEIQVLNATEAENNFTKSGMYLLPKIAPIYETVEDKILVYFEVYGDKSGDSVFVLKQKVIEADGGNELKEYARTSNVKNDLVTPLVKKILISNLITGKYYMYFELFNTKDSLLAYTGININRENANVQDESPLDYENTALDPDFLKSIPLDSAEYFLASLMPIVRSAEQKNIIKLLKIKNNVAAQKYIQSFWRTTNDKNNRNAYESWLSYKTAVLEVQQSFGTNLFPGHQTDRGRVYLQYGQATTIIMRESTPTEYPYEIWQYDKIANFSNKRFIFYNPDLVNNNYTLLHSDLIGEVNNYRWEYILNKRNSANLDIDSPNGGNGDATGRNSRSLYKQY
jgi:GWxTD domain-containing protein